MISAQFKADLAKMEKEGISITVEEAVRLNSLALRIAREKNALDLFAAPRRIAVGGAELHEPTYASEDFLRRIAPWFSDEQYYTAQAFALAHAVIPGFFGTLSGLSRDDLAHRINAWFSSLACTGEQLIFAMDYVCTGFEESFGESAEKSDRKTECLHATFEDCSATDFNEAVAAGLGLTAEIFGTFTQSRLYDILRRAWRNRRGSLEMPETSQRAFAEYARTRDAIIRRHQESERGNSSNG